MWPTPHRCTLFPYTTRFRSHGIGKAKGDELDETGKIAMRQITALMPTEKTEGALLVRKLPIRPAVFLRHQIAQVFALGLRFHVWSAGLRPGAWVVWIGTRRVGDRRSITSAAMA